MKYRFIYTLLSILFVTFLFGSCTKDVPKDMQQTEKQAPPVNPQTQMPDDDIHRNLKSGQDQTTDTDTSKSKGDPKADQLSKEADDADAKFQKTKSDADKNTCILKQLTAANYLMFEANLSPKKKYKPALKRYNRILEIDPGNSEAMENKKQIEDIYTSMGMPIPN
ncbi:MAG TPA: hypothetical protein VJ455_12870 [Ignavibacteria bacterium]|nr:hypothetical protein [Ignavibacteria bacterium]